VVLQSVVVASRTTRFNIKKNTFCLHITFMSFVCISEQKAINCVYRVNWLVFVTPGQCIYCVVRTGSWNIFQVILRLQMFKIPLVRPDDVKILYLCNFCRYCLPLFSSWTYQFKIRLPTRFSKPEY